jgi:hypothetical protein
MNPLRKSIFSLKKTGIKKIDRNIFKNIFAYDNVKILNVLFGQQGLLLLLKLKPVLFSSRK